MGTPTIRMHIQGLLAVAAMHLDDAVEVMDDAARANLKRGGGIPRDPNEGEEGDPSPITFALADIDLAVEALTEAREVNAQRSNAKVVRPVKDVMAEAVDEEGPGTPRFIVESAGDPTTIAGCRELLQGLADTLPPCDAKDSIDFALEWKAQHSHEKYDLQATRDQALRSMMIDCRIPPDACEVAYLAMGVVLELTPEGGAR